MALCLGYKFTALDAAGAPLAAGLVYTYDPGTTTNKATYSDRSLSSANANPVVLDAAGQADIYLNGLTKLVIKTAAGATVDTVDNVCGLVEAYDSPTFVDVTVSDDLTVGDDVTITDDLTVGGAVAITGDMTVGNVTTSGYFVTPYALAFTAVTLAANAALKSVYVDSVDGKLYFRDAGGTARALY